MDIFALNIKRGAKLVVRISQFGVARLSLHQSQCCCVRADSTTLQSRGISFLVGLGQPK